MGLFPKILLFSTPIYMFSCRDCAKTFTRKENFISHTRKKTCRNRIYKCDCCGTGYSIKNNMYRHMKTCKIKEEIYINEKNRELINNKLLDLEKKYEEIRTENAILKEKIWNNNSININGTVNINIGKTINKFVVIGYGKEDLSKIDKREITKAFKMGFHSTIILTEIIHFNPKYPEFQNVYIPNMKNKYASKYNEKYWELIGVDMMVDMMYEDKKSFIEENLEEYEEYLSEHQKETIKRWIHVNDNTNKNKIEINKIKDIKGRIKLLMFNKKDMIIENKKK